MGFFCSAALTKQVDANVRNRTYILTPASNPAIDAGLFVETGDNLLEGRNLLAITTVFVCSRPWGMTSIGPNFETRKSLEVWHATSVALQNSPWHGPHGG